VRVLTVFGCSEFILTVSLLGDSENDKRWEKFGENLNVRFCPKCRHYLVVPRMYHKICKTGQ
jgi:hypothetical protein